MGPTIKIRMQQQTTDWSLINEHDQQRRKKEAEVDPESDELWLGH